MEIVPWSEKIQTAVIVADGRVVTAKVVPIGPEDGRSYPVEPFVASFPFVTDIPYISFLLR